MASRVLTVSAIERAKAKDKQYLIPDYDGLYLRVYPSGKKTWIIRSFIGGKEKQITIGIFPQMTLSEARQYRDNYKAHQKYGGRDRNTETLIQLFEQWHKTVIVPTVTPKSARDIALRFGYASDLHRLSVESITREDVVNSLNKISMHRGVDTVRRVSETLRRLFNYAIDTGKIVVNPAMRLKSNVPVLLQWKQEHFVAATKRTDIKELMDVVDAVNSTTVRYALKLMAYTFVRRDELRFATWDEINEQERIWLLPAERTKLRREQMVPLSEQAWNILAEMKKRYIPGRGKFIFQSTKGKAFYLASSTMLTALRAAIVKIRSNLPSGITLHGFRSTASTLLHEAEWEHYAIERQLSHVDKNAVSAAYNRAEYIGTRKKMMQWYADALDAIQAGKQLPDKPE